MLASVTLYDKKWSRQDIRRVINRPDSVMDLIDGRWADFRTTAFIGGMVVAAIAAEAFKKVAGMMNKGVDVGSIVIAIILLTDFINEGRAGSRTLSYASTVFIGYYINSALKKGAAMVRKDRKVGGVASAVILLTMGGAEGSRYYLQCKLSELDRHYSGYRVVVTGSVSEYDMEEIHRTVDFIPY